MLAPVKWFHILKLFIKERTLSHSDWKSLYQGGVCITQSAIYFGQSWLKNLLFFLHPIPLKWDVVQKEMIVKMFNLPQTWNLVSYLNICCDRLSRDSSVWRVASDNSVTWCITPTTTTTHLLLAHSSPRSPDLTGYYRIRQVYSFNSIVTV